MSRKASDLAYFLNMIYGVTKDNQKMVVKQEASG